MAACEIPLTRGQVAIVDSEDYAWLMQWKWYAIWSQNNRSFYAATKIKGRVVRMHQMILGTIPPIVGDHINHKTLDNRRVNLRAITELQNRRNKRCYSTNTSGYKGVSWSKKANKWVANIMVEGKYKHLGYFSEIECAAHSYDEAALKYHGEFSYLNFPHQRHPPSPIEAVPERGLK